MDIEEQSEIEKEKEEIGNAFIEMINNLNWRDKIKLFFWTIWGIISSYFKLLIHKIKELKK